MTLKEQLDEKIRQDRAFTLWEEIKDIFLLSDTAELYNGLSIMVFTHFDNMPIHYIKNPKASTVTKDFSNSYYIETMEKVVEICEENGLTVNKSDELSFFINYTPLSD